MAHTSGLRRRAAVWLAILATLAATLILVSPPSSDAAAPRCYRAAKTRGYEAVFVIVGRPCMSRVAYRCRGHQRQRHRLAHVRVITVATVECPRPVAFARIR